MPKRSLNPGNGGSKKLDAKKVGQLNKALDAMLARTDSKLPKANASIEPLVRIAAELRDLPRKSFRKRLKSALIRPEEKKGEEKMTSVAERITSTHKAASPTLATPRLAFKDAAAAIKFYERAFGAKETFRFEAGGSIPHAEIMIGESVIDLTDEWPAGGRFSAETLGSSPVQMTLQVEDVDAAFARAVDAGMTVRRPLANQFYGHREGTLDDPFGYTWNIYTVVEEMSLEEMHRRMERPQGAVTKPEVSPVPRGFFMVTPYIVTPDGDAMLDFAKNAFGAEVLLRATGGSGGGVHGEVRIGDTMLMMGGGIPGKPFSAKPQLTALHVYVKDTDAVYKKALEAGATSLGAPQDHDYGERGASVKDPFGNFWYIATHKGESYVPMGMHNVNAYLHPLRTEPLIGFLKRAFGAEEISKYASPDGVVHHAAIRVGDAVLEMGDARGPYQPMPSMFYVYVPDCDAVYKRALAAGAKSLHEVQDQPYGDRNGAVTDPFGNIWYVATHVKDVTP